MDPEGPEHERKHELYAIIRWGARWFSVLGCSRRSTMWAFRGAVAANGRATVGLTELEARHAFANIALTDNVVRFATRRYCDNPLIVQGPGAGPEVTAGGVFSDLLRLSAYLGAHL